MLVDSSHRKEKESSVFFFKIYNQTPAHKTRNNTPNPRSTDAIAASVISLNKSRLDLGVESSYTKKVPIATNPAAHRVTHRITKNVGETRGKNGTVDLGRTSRPEPHIRG